MVVLPLVSLGLVAACADTALVDRASAPRAGFASVAETARRAQVGTPAWHQDATQIAAAEARVKQLIQGKTITADTAAQAGLINNRGLQAAYADLGLSAADLWQAALGSVPSLGLSVSGLAGDVTRSLEATLITAVVDAATARPRSQVAALRFEQAQLAAAGATVEHAVTTRRAWIDAVAAFEAAAIIARAQNAANAASELATELGRTGAMNAADQAREHAFTAEIAAELADARLEAQLAKERLARLMGLSGSDVAFYVPDALPGLPARPRSRADIESLALANRVDLAAGRIELQAVAAEYRLTGQTRMVSDIEIMAGFETERQNGKTETSPVVDVAFQIPLHDTAKMASRRGALTYMRAANRLAQAAIDARAEARAAHMAVTGKHAVARHWRDTVLPLRRRIDEEALKSYNGMITSTFELLEDTRDGLEAELGAARAKRDYWLAETMVTAAIWGGTVNTFGSEGDEE
ncbi:MAG: TolC family protein [Pseudooceanicola sp.]|nr:TolC family protein [Pseudooceanicola sp.]